MTTMLPMELTAVLGFVCLGAMGFLQYRYTRDCCDEGKIFNAAPKKSLPVLSIENVGNGHATFALGTKDEDEDPVFEIDGVSMKVDPSMCSGGAEPTRYKKGLNIWHYASSKFLPISSRTALAYQTIKMHRSDQKKLKMLSFLTDSELFTLLKQPRELLPDAAAVFLEKYSPTQPKVDYTEEDQEMPLDEMVIILCEMQDYMTALPVEGGLFCYHSAFKDLPYAHSSQDIQRIKYLFEQKIWEQFKDQDKMWTRILMVIALLGATGGLVYILSMAFGS